MSLRFEQRGDRVCQIFKGERFAQKISSFIQWNHGSNLVGSVAADKEGWKGRFFLDEFGGELIAGQPGHDDIREEKIDFRIPAEALDGFSARTSLQDRMATEEQVLVEELPQVFVVIHQQDGSNWIQISGWHLALVTRLRKGGQPKNRYCRESSVPDVVVKP